MKENKVQMFDTIFKNAVEDYYENDDLITAMNLALYYRGKEKEESKELFNRVLKKNTKNSKKKFFYKKTLLDFNVII